MSVSFVCPMWVVITQCQIPWENLTRGHHSREFSNCIETSCDLLCESNLAFIPQIACSNMNKFTARKPQTPPTAAEATLDACRGFSLDRNMYSLNCLLQIIEVPICNNTFLILTGYLSYTSTEGLVEGAVVYVCTPTAYHMIVTRTHYWTSCSCAGLRSHVGCQGMQPSSSVGCSSTSYLQYFVPDH